MDMKGRLWRGVKEQGTPEPALNSCLRSFSVLDLGPGKFGEGYPVSDRFNPRALDGSTIRTRNTEAKMTDPVTQEIREASRWGLILGIVTIVLGVLAIGAPMVPGLAVAIMVGVMLLLAGVSQTVFAFKAGSVGRGVFAFLFGGVAILAGALMLARPLIGLATITMVVVWYLILDGVSRLATAYRSPPYQGRGWLIFGGVVSLLLGLMIWRDWPLSGGWVVGTLVGIRLILAGWVMMAVAGVGRAAAREMDGDA